MNRTSIAFSWLAAGCAAAPAATFESPEEAVRTLVQAAEDEAVAEELLGAGGFELLRSGDAVADRADLEAVVALIGEGLAFEDAGESRKVALLGNDGWELPIPLVVEDGRWRFDVEAGREEILNRRVGRNELSTIATLRAIVEAQSEYSAAGHGGEAGVYAARIMSAAGSRDGLYWPAAAGEPESPLGPLVAQASAEGYGRAGETEGPVPYHGYHYRLLTEQGEHAPGGARSYLDEQGRLTRGFGVIAWPATYGSSGVMTFLVDRLGIVFEKDLGPSTAGAAVEIPSFDPDTSWAPSAD